MKSIKEMMVESSKKSFVLDDGQRDALVEFVGHVCGAYNDENPFDAVEVDDDEKQRLETLFDVLDDRQSYKKINSRILKNDLPLLKKCLNAAFKADQLDGNDDLEDVQTYVNDAV